MMGFKDDPMQGDMFKRDALERVEENASNSWKHAALDAVRRVALNYEELTTDDVFRIIPDHLTTHEPRAMGAIMTKAAKYGWIEVIEDKWRKSVQPQCHKRPMQVWRSKLRSWS